MEEGAAGPPLESNPKPLFSFGVISDVQYADIDDGQSFHGVKRYYRHALHALRQAIQTWNGMNEEEENAISFVINLGDIIDGFAKHNTLDQLDCVLQVFREFQGPVYHLLGNHCLYNLSRAQLHPKLGLAADVPAYYDFAPHERFRFVMVDPYDISIMGWPEGHPRRAAAERILKQHNPNADMNSPVGLRGYRRRYVAFNGALGDEQMEWLEKVLEDATAKEQRVVICTHVPLCPHDQTAYAVIWNYEEVMALMKKFNCVKVVLAGHDHAGGYRNHHVHHYIFPGVVECEPGTNAFSRMDVYDDKIVMKGFGGLGDMVFDFRPDHHAAEKSTNKGGA